LKLRNFIINPESTCNELIWDNYNAPTMAYSKSDKLISAQIQAKSIVMSVSEKKKKPNN